MELATAKGNKVDYYHFYIELPATRRGDKKRSSPNFRKEAYKLGDFTLVAYIGDHSELDRREESLKQKRDQLVENINLHHGLQNVKTLPGRSYNTIGVTGKQVTMKACLFF